MVKPWRAFHRRIGLWLGLWFCWLGVTGFALAWGPYWEEWIRPQLHRVEQGNWEGRLQACLEAVGEAYPKHRVERLDLPRNPGRSLRFTLNDKRLVYVDPSGPRVLGDLRPEQTLRGQILPLHEWGLKFLPWLAMVFSLLLLSGWILQLPRPQLVRRLWQRRDWRRALDIHRMAGWLATPALCLALATGAVLSDSGWFEKLLGARSYPKVKVTEEVSKLASLDLFIAQARRALPESRPSRLHWPADGHRAFEVRVRQSGEFNPYGRSYVHLHPSSARILQVDDALAQNSLVQWLYGSYTLHAGYYWGGPLLVGLPGLFPLLLWWSGLRLRLRRGKGN